MATVTSCVKDIMTRHLFQLNPGDSLQKAQRMMEDKHIRHLPVVENHKLVGILSLTDIMRLSFVETYGEKQRGIDAEMYDLLTTQQVMRINPHTVEVNESLHDVASKLVEEEYHALPVLDNEKLVGIITTTDVIKHFLKN
jgi:CBS domain-containing membrane protein